MTKNAPSSFRIGKWEALPLRNTLVGPSGEIHVEPKVMQVLELLVEHAGQVVERDEFLDRIWGGRAVSDEPLTRCVAALRRALGDSPSNPKYVQTIPKRGYRLVCSVERLAGVATEASIRSQSHTFTASVRSVFLHPAFAAFFVTTLIVAAIGYFFAANVRTSPPALPSLSAGGTIISRAGAISIAVLPLRTNKINPAAQPFGSGISDGLRTGLQQIPGFTVSAHTSSEAVVRLALDVPAIAKRLNVGYVVEGTLEMDGRDLTIVLQLVDENGNVRWTEPFKRAENEIFALQEEMVRAVATQFGVDQSTETSRTIPKITAPTSDLEAHRQYLIGKYSPLDPTVPMKDSNAVAAFKKALDRDPMYAAVYPAIATRYALDCWGKDDRQSTSCNLAIEYAEKGLKLDPTLADALATLALVHAIRYDFYEAQAAIERMANLPGPGIVSLSLPSAHLLLGHVQLAWDTAQEFHKRDPLNPGAIMLMESWAYLLKGDKDLGEHYRQISRELTGIDLASGYPSVRLDRVDLEQAIEDARRILPLFQVSPDIAEYWVRPHYEPSYTPHALARLKDLYERGEIRPTVYWMALTTFLQTDTAMDMSFELYDQGLLNPVQFWIRAAGRTEMRNHPRFGELLSYTGFADYWDETGWPRFCERRADDYFCGLEVKVE